MIILENNYLKIRVKPEGAELVQLYSKITDIDYIWSADPAFWGKSSPILFPIVGGLKNNVFVFEGEKYNLPRHGFARDYRFEIEKQSKQTAVFLLKYDEETYKIYPFRFELRLTYKLDKNKVLLSYNVKNIDSKPIYFSIGGHPAFAVPLDKTLKYDDYFLEFNQTESLLRFPLNAEGLILKKPVLLINSENILPLNYSLFAEDALVFKNLKSTKLSVKSNKSSNGLNFEFHDFPYFGIWAAKNANFVCLEPWCGIADSENHNQELSQKEGINKLPVDHDFERTWSVEVY